jgi:glycosyltransferase involved in cell wall biosynthesis
VVRSRRGGKGTLLVVTAVYPPEPVVTARTSAELASIARETGWETVTLCPEPSRGIVPDEARKVYDRDPSVTRVRTWKSRKSQVLSRLTENLTFALRIFWYVLFRTNATVIYCNTWPIFSSGAAIFAAHLRGIPVVLSVQDLYPESLISQSRIQPNGWIALTLMWLDRLVCQGAHTVIVPGIAMRERLIQSRSLNPDKVHFVPNWLPMVDSQSDTKSQLPVDVAASSIDARKLLFAGNIGRASGIVECLEGIGSWLERSGWSLTIAGSGSEVGLVRQIISDAGWTRIHLHTPWLPDESLALFYSTDVCLLPTVGQQALASIPSKLLSYWQNSKFVLALASPGSDLAATIGQSRAGLTVAPDDYVGLCDALSLLQAKPRSELRSLGHAGADFARESFDGRHWCGIVIQLIASAAGLQ